LRVFATKWFVRFAHKEKLADARLLEAVSRIRRGIIDADLGGHLVKQRVAREGGGRSGGYRTFVAFHAGRRSVFLYGFAKSERQNIDPSELADLKALARVFLTMSDSEVEKAVNEKELKELRGDEQ
jgi:hypothetical protein